GAGHIAATRAPGGGRALVTTGGYTAQNRVTPGAPAPPRAGRAYWYQWYSNPERGRRGLEHNRRDICRLLWEEWSPTWRFDQVTFDRTAPSFDNPDFVAVVIHSYRHPHGNAPGDRRLVAVQPRPPRGPPA